MGEFTVHGQKQSRWTGAFFTVHSNGQVYVSSEAYQEFLDEAEQVLVMVDTDDMRLGLQPSDEDTAEAQSLSSQKLTCLNAFRRMGANLPEDTERYLVQTDDEHDPPFIVLASDSDRSAPASQPETNESSETFTDDSTEVPDHFVKTSGGDLHAPSDDSTLDDPDPYCTGRDADWQAKELETIPPNFYDHCGSCEDRIEEIREQR